MDNCPNCRSISTSFVSHISVITTCKQIRFELLCMTCGIVYLAYANPYQYEHNVYRCRMTFETSWKPKGKATIRVMKNNDLTFYREWAKVLNHFTGSLEEKLNSKQHSDFCCHFFYLTIRVFTFLRSICDRRIKQLELIMQEEDDGC